MGRKGDPWTQQKLAAESSQTSAEHKTLLQRVKEEQATYRRQLLEQISGDHERQTKTKVVEVAKDKDLTGLALESYRPNKRREQLRDSCSQFNHQRVEARRAHTPLPEPAEPMDRDDSPMTSQHQTAMANTQAEKAGWREYYRAEIKHKEDQKQASREAKSREQHLVEERVQAIQREIQAERKRVRENQRQIRSILSTQLEAKKAARELDRSTDRLFREELERSASPQPLPDRPQCKLCRSPIK